VAHAHVDIAGPAWDNKASIATGMGATTLAEWACAQGAAPRDSEACAQGAAPRDSE